MAGDKHMADLPGEATNNFVTVGGIVGAAVIGAVTQSTKWVDKSGKFSPLIMISGIALCLVFGSFVHWIGLEKGIDTWTQIVITGIGCYMGPDIVLRAVYSAVMKRAGVDVDGTNPKGDAKP